MLLFGTRIMVARISALISGQRRGRRHRAAIPAVPARATLLPVAPPMLAPARRRARFPAAEIRRRPPVVAHGDTQYVERHVLGRHAIPRTVVPITRIPLI